MVCRRSQQKLVHVSKVAGTSPMIMLICPICSKPFCLVSVSRIQDTCTINTISYKGETQGQYIDGQCDKLRNINGGYRRNKTYATMALPP